MTHTMGINKLILGPIFSESTVIMERGEYPKQQQNVLPPDLWLLFL